MNPSIELELRYGAHNYEPLPVTLIRGEGIYVWDEAGKRYYDMMGAYSAVSHGHCHPKILQALKDQASQLGVISRAYFSDKLGAFLQQACELSGQDKALPMNTGAEAVETALKAARKWAYTVKGIRQNKAEIISCENNFHGRTIAIISMSSEPQYQAGFGPFLPGLRTIRYGNVQELEMAITHNTAAFLVEPIQGEGGIIVPPPGYLKTCAEICKKNNVLLICDEVQTGLGRTGKFLACSHEGVKPDGVILGKALGGGFLPVSMFLARKEVMDVFQPGDHGSTFGGSPLASAVGAMALKVLVEEGLIERAAEMGKYFMDGLRAISSPLIKEIRGKGLLIGMEIRAPFSAHEVCLNLLKHGVLSKDTHRTVIRFAPPLVITKEQIDEVLKVVKQALDEIKPEDIEADDVEVTLPKREEEVAPAPVKKRAAPRKPRKPTVIEAKVETPAVTETPSESTPPPADTSVQAEPEAVAITPAVRETPAETVPPEVVEAAKVEAAEMKPAVQAEPGQPVVEPPVEVQAEPQAEPQAPATEAEAPQADVPVQSAPVEEPKTEPAEKASIVLEETVEKVQGEQKPEPVEEKKESDA